MKARCFFSHCWKDSKQSDYIKNYIVQLVKEKSNNRINVIYDRETFNVSDDLVNNENQILSSDSVVIFCSTEYKMQFSKIM